jgi:multiple sugar transport system permease protein
MLTLYQFRGMAPERGHAGYGFVAPAFFIILVFFFVPLTGALLLGFTDFDIYALGDLAYLRFIGIDNYTRLARDPLFWKALLNTIVFVVSAGPLTVLPALGLALLLHARVTRFRGFFRTALFLPVVTTVVAVAVVWRYLYHPEYGPMAAVLGVFGVEPIDWLGDPHWALPAIILMAVWKNFGYSMVVFLAGLHAIPGQLYEAARIDGANAWQQFRHITLPLLAPTALFVAVLTLVGYLQLFAEPYVMTQGGPSQSTLSVVLLMYEEGFRWWNMGYAAAVAFLLFGIIVAGGVGLRRMQKRWVS